MSKIITCPSGLSGEIRGITGKNFELLTNRQLQRSGLFVDKMLAACWLSTLDPGPYEVGEDGKLDWQKVLAGDRFYAVMQVRISMYGPKYTFPAQCSEAKCRNPFGWEVDLENDLPVKLFAPADLEAFRNGNRLEGDVPGSTPENPRKFRFRLATGSDEVKIAKLVTQSAAFIPAIVARLYDIDGVPAGGLRRFFENEEISVAFDMLREMDKHDCGIETGFEIECPKCGSIKEVQIPFDQGFLIPSKSRSSRVETIEETTDR